jgi:HK97 family phage major capsid protein
MDSVKALEEELDGLAIEAKALVEVAKRDNREMDSEESARFDEVTGTKIPETKKRLATAIKREETMASLSVSAKRQTQAEELDDILNRPARGPRLVLPVNGELPDDQIVNKGNFNRIGKLKCFKSEQDAINAGMWLRCVVAREYNRGEDKVAMQHVRRLGWEVTNTGVEGTGSLGGYLVPAPVASAIIDVREKVGVSRSILRVMPMTSDTLSITRRASGLTVYYGTEAPPADMTASDKSWSQVKLIAEKRYVVHQISQELVDDALIAIVDDAIQEMGYALARKEDDELINGDGTSTYGLVTGLLSSLGAGGVSTATGGDTWPELTSGDFTAAMGLLPDEYAVDPVWLCSRAFYHNVMLRIEAAAGGNTIQSLQGGDGGRKQFLGYPVETTNRMPTATAVATVCCLFGTFSMAAILGERTGMRVARSDDFAFLRDVTTIKATARYDIKVHAGGTASAPGGYVGLKTAS